MARLDLVRGGGASGGIVLPDPAAVLVALRKFVAFGEELLPGGAAVDGALLVLGLAVAGAGIEEARLGAEPADEGGLRRARGEDEVAGAASRTTSA